MSIALHMAFVAITLIGNGRAGAMLREPTPLRTILAVPDIASTLETIPVSVPMIVPTLSREPLATLSLPTASTPPEPMPAAAPRGPSSDGSGVGQSVGVLLSDRNRLGDLHGRSQSEFPIEIDKPVRLDGRIVARYPAAALAAGREDSVVAWVVVNEQGRASEIEIPEGTEEFADQVRAALRAARFLPAEDKLQPIRFPIALQFDFRSGAIAGKAKEAK